MCSCNETDASEPAAADAAMRCCDFGVSVKLCQARRLMPMSDGTQLLGHLHGRAQFLADFAQSRPIKFELGSGERHMK